MSKEPKGQKSAQSCGKAVHTERQWKAAAFKSVRSGTKQTAAEQSAAVCQVKNTYNRINVHAFRDTRDSNSVRMKRQMPFRAI